MELLDIPSDDRRLLATWAIKTSRTEELTGQQVFRLLPTVKSDAQTQHVVQHGIDEFRHAQLYAEFADELVRGTGPQSPSEWVPGADFKWLRDYVAKRSNFRDAGFTSIFRVMDSIPMPLMVGREDDDFNMIRFYTALFFLDLAGLMTVNVYDEAPFTALQRIALEVREDESRHVQFGRNFLVEGHSPETIMFPHAPREQVQAAVREMMPHIQQFFGADQSPTQKVLQKHGFRNTSNAELFGRFEKKVSALLRVEV